MIDGLFPLVPSESLVVSAGVFAATGEPNLVAVIGVAALGGTILIVCRYIPGARTAITLTAGDPLPAALVLGIALTVTLLVEVVRHLRRQRTIPAHC